VVSTALAIVLGMLIGLRHAFEPDHLTAVSTLVSETHSPRQGVWLGVLWGLGHTISLFVVGSVLAIVGATLPVGAAVAFELAVAVMLLVLGVRAIAVAMNTASHGHRDAKIAGRRWRPVVVGLVHGLAGSGALTALVFAQLPGTAARLLYVGVFGAGSIVGMGLASGLAGFTLRAVARSPDSRRRIGIATGFVSIVVALLWGIPLVS
jgi:high-affinity nickel-transport protein